MALDQIAAFAEIIASIAVVASLIYVAVQLRQNTDAIHAQSREAIKTGSLSELFKVMDQPDLMLLITDKETLTPLEQSRLNAYFFASMRAREFSWLQYRNGVIDRSQWQTELLVTQFFLDSKKLRVWWDKVGRAGFSDEYGEFIDALLAKAPATDTGFGLESRWFDGDGASLEIEFER
jgi:hypothetical protein